MPRLPRLGYSIPALLLGGLMALGATLHAAVPSLQHYLEANGFVAVPFDTSDSNALFRIDTLVNGRPVRFMVDTGAPLSVLKANEAEGIKTLRELHQTMPDGFGHLITNPDIVVIDSWQMGPVTLSHEPALRHDMPMGHAHPDFNGLLGLDFLYRHNGLIDGGAQKLYLRESPLSPVQLAAIKRSLARSGFLSVPIAHGQRLRVESKINQKPLDWLVDTGAVLSTIDKTGETQLGLQPFTALRSGLDNPHIMELQGFKGVGIGAKYFHVLKLDELQIGERIWHQLSVTGSDISFDHGSPNAAGLQMHGILGEDVLATAGVLLDPRDGVMWFRHVSN